jgi:hypothetical protein
MPRLALVVALLLLTVPGRADDGDPLAGAFAPPAALRGDPGPYRSPLRFADGRPVRDAADWAGRREEIRRDWFGLIGAWPPLIERPKVEVLEAGIRENFTQRRVRVEVAADRTMDGYLLVPPGEGPFPAVLVVFYEPETAVGLGNAKPGRDFALQLVRRGFVALSLGISPDQITPGQGGYPAIQPLSYLAYVAANAYNAMATLPEVDPARVGVMGHSYGGKWALFASCLDDRFACGVWSDPGVVFDESRSNVNYWEPWYLGWEPGRTRNRGVVTPESPRTGAYATMIERGHDLHELHALMAPRPLLVSGGSEDPPERWRALNHAVAVNRLLGASDRVAMTNRPKHDPSPESNEAIVRFLEQVLKPDHAKR